ncbi:sigma-E factor regulatory protein RseB domain-containing protein [Nocardiopsis rhodophaea]|uniref:sigma-E factor regulatory protein RseB domain-containing protein n=1 Tax=Nocardiopsis rhodophaea TaxID=280238 RepID=UPI0031D28B12
MTLLIVVPLTASGSRGAAATAPEGDDDGMALLRRAAQAEFGTSYQGVQSVTSGIGSEVETRLVQVVHRAGHGTEYGGPPGTTGADRVVVAPSPTLLRMDEKLLGVLADNYRVTRAGSGTICGRRATVVEALRANGTVAGRFWIDDGTGLPLRQEIRDGGGRIAHSTEFTEFQTDVGGGAVPVSAHRELPWKGMTSAEQLDDLRAEGWTVPDYLDWDLSLIEVWSRGAGEGRVLHLSYSDGLSVVSVFLQRGRLDDASEGTDSGLTAVGNGDSTVYVDNAGQQRRVWETDGYVYTVLADAPEETVKAAVAGLPAPDGSGFWPRVMRGFERLGSWTGLPLAEAT